MKTIYTIKRKLLFLCAFLFIISVVDNKLHSQSFSQTNLNFNGKVSVNNGTSLTFGPDGRLYVTEYTGQIKIYTIDRSGPGQYIVQKIEVLNGILQIQDHNDDGSLHTSTFRESIGLVVTGTAANPVIYVSSSDFRIGGGGGGGSGDVGLDTNSGIITRFTWTGTTWEVVDIVRGLPRSEENHATNGMEFTTINGEDYLIVAQGGNTNAGGPSKNFAYTTEYALSAAILSVNLSMLEAMPILDDNGRKYIYDLPTLDDPTRPNKNGITDPDHPLYDGIDVNDPFGGNDGLNQAIIVPGGPVQVFSPGYRNAYDLVVTEKGAVYVTDNGANGGWGGFPVNQGGGDANNDYDPNEPGSSTATADGEKVNNKDHLTMVTLDIQNYQFGSFYGGHPTPMRANPYGAGLYTNPAVTGTEGAVFRTKIYHPSKNDETYTSDPNLGLPANWPPVQVANPVEGDYRSPGDPNPDGPEDVLVTIWGTNTNGIDEYKASNFNGAMKGDLIAGVNTGELRRVELNEDGTLKNLTPSFASGIGGNALGIACNGDYDIFPGTIWVVTLNGLLVVFEPQDFGTCLQPGDEGYNPLADYDFDGYTNQDEIDNGTDPCNGASQPSDHDKAAGAPLISDLNDLDDDSDGIPDAEDPFQLGDPLKGGSDAFELPVINELFSSNLVLQGYMGLGLTGLMNNGNPNPNWLNWLDRRDDPNDPNPNDILGGAIGAMTMHMTSGTALGANNNQEKGFQYGVQVDQSTGVFTVAGGMFNFNDPLQLYGHPNAPNGELGIFIGTGFQDNYIKFVLTKNWLTIQQELNDVPQDPLKVTIPVQDRPQLGAALFYVIDPSTGNIDLEYSFDNGPRISAGSITAQGAILEAIQNVGKDLAVGLIGTSNATGVEVEGTWDYLNVTTGNPAIVQKIENIERQVGSASEVLNLNNYFFDDKGVENLTYTVIENTNSAFNLVIEGHFITIGFPSFPANTSITIRATDADNNYIEQSFTASIIETPIVLYRVNAGGPLISSIDGEMDWGADFTTENSPYLTVPGGNLSAGFPMIGYSSTVDQSTTPVSIFDTERYDGVAGPPNMTYSFPVSAQGSYIVRLYMANGWDGTSSPGQRVFDVQIEGFIHPQMKDIDLSALFGHGIGGMIDQTVEVTDGWLDISFIHGIQNPLINGIEILSVSQSSNPIQVVQLEDQIDVAGEQLDGSLAVQATGGDGNLSYSMVGAPAGIVIEPTNGQIGGTIDANANLQSPYTVTITLDDSDEIVNDAVTMQFQWFIITDDPYIVKEFPEMKRIIGSPDEQVDLNEFFADNDGVEGLIYSLPGYIEGAIVASLSANIITLNYPEVPAESTIIIRATDNTGNFVEQNLVVRVIEAPETFVLYRINAGGPAINSLDHEMDWGADTGTYKSPYLSAAGSNTTNGFPMTGYSSTVDQSTMPVSIFNTERYDGAAGPPNMTYSFPVSAQGSYIVRLYMANGWNGTSSPGQRVFDVEIEGYIHPQLNDIDLSALFGHGIGGMIDQVVEVTDGSLDISFIHVVQNPLINGIEILKTGETGNPIQVVQLEDQSNAIGENIDGSLTVVATGGDGALNYTINGAPLGISINASTGVISGMIAIDADKFSPYDVVVTIDDSDGDLNDTVTMQFEWRILSESSLSWIDKNENENYTGRHECSFVQAGDKFYLMGGRESAKTVDIYDYATNTWSSLINSAPLEFNHFQATEYQGLIWIIGAFKTNNFPSELPAEHIWIFNPKSNEWIQGPQIPLNRQRGSAGLTVYNDKFYISGGNTIGHNGGFVAWFDEYDPATGIWTVLADAPRARDHFHSAVIGDKLYLAGGRLSGGTGGASKPVIPEVDVYDFSTLTWSTIPANLPTPRAGASVVEFENKLLVIGGEVDNENVYGVVVSDALKITEEYNPESGLWSRIADLNYKRHGTQAIVSGNGVYTLAGSPNKGGGNQKNMEYLGIDAPEGEPGITSIISVPSSVQLSRGVSKEIPLKIIEGNIGIFIASIELQGTESGKFNILSGNLTNALLKANSQHIIVVEYIGLDGTETANLLIKYGLAGQEVIALAITNNSIAITTIPDQINVNGDVLDGSLIVTATGGDGALNYSMTGAPAGVSIDPVTGVISGLIAIDADLSSPYNVSITVDDSDEVTADVVTTTFNWTVIPNQLPSVTITTPIDNAAFTTPVDISIDATASDSDGTVAKVEFFEGTTKLGEDLDGSNGWSYAWNNVLAGTYSLTAIATDDMGAVTTSAAVNIRVSDPVNEAPSVAITTPIENATFTTPVDITIDATALDTDGTVAKVEFFHGTTKLVEDLDGSNGWNYAWNNVPAGTYSLTAIATDDKGSATTSAAVNITVSDPANSAPSVAITTPLNNATFTTPANINITATASDTDGTVAKVEFFEGTTKLGEDLDGSNGWNYAWNNVPAGTYSLTAIATDDKGAATTSAAVNITVSNPPSPVITSFSPTSGPIGTLVTINGNNFANATSVTFGPSSAQIISNTDTKIEALVPSVNGKLPSRVKITVTTTGGNNTSSERFTITAGTVPVNALPIVAINTPVNNENFIAPASIGITASASDPDGSVVKVEFFNGTAKLGEDLTSPYAYTWNNVATGNYSLTAKATDDKGAVTTSEAVNISVSSSDNTAPAVVITSPANNANFTAPANISITASASDTDGTVVKVEFFNGDAKLGEDLTSPYSFTWNNVATGNYSLTAKATDDKGAVSTSAVVDITLGAASELASPYNLFVEWASSSQVNLYWQDNSFDEDGFVLERAYKADFTGKVDIINLSPNTISYQDSNLNNKRAVYYRIKAVRGSLSSAYSNIASPIATLKAMETSGKDAEAALYEEEPEAQESISIKLYPNPANAEVYLQAPNPSVLITAVAIYDYGGRYIRTYSTGQDLTNEGNERYRFNIQGMPNKVYILKVSTESSGVFNLRLIKED